MTHIEGKSVNIWLRYDLKGNDMHSFFYVSPMIHPKILHFCTLWLIWALRKLFIFGINSLEHKEKSSINIIVITFKVFVLSFSVYMWPNSHLWFWCQFEWEFTYYHCTIMLPFHFSNGAEQSNPLEKFVWVFTYAIFEHFHI